MKIALLGFGTVGQGVWKVLNTNRNEIMQNCGYDIEISKILVRDINKPRKITVPKGILTTDENEIFNDKDIKIIIELIGGSEPATSYMLRAMKSKRHVVTANKLSLATQGEILFETAEREGVLFYYEASVGGGIPIIRGINESLTANKIEKIVGIINGTTNYILTKMTLEGMDFNEALREAQDKGYSEADPTSDVEAYDAAYKLAIISSLSFGTKVDFHSIFREGISKIQVSDIRYAKKLGYVIKLLAIGREVSSKLELRVQPALIRKEHPIANVNDAYNAIFIRGNALGDLMLYGKGAGDLPTGSAVVGDIISILRNNAYTTLKKSSALKEVQSHSESISGYYIRLNVKDKQRTLEQITDILGRNNVNIPDALHEDEIVLITRETSLGNMNESLNMIRSLDKVNKIENVIRIENLE